MHENGSGMTSRPRVTSRPPAPSAARVYEYWLGGTDWHDGDRAAARAVEDALGPGLGHVPRQMAVADREFCARAARWAAGRGIGQAVVLGAGLPARSRATGAPDIHQAVPSVRVTYVSADPLVVSHAAAMTAGLPLVHAAHGDPADPPAVLAALHGAGLADLARPAAVIIPRAMGFMPAREAAEAAWGCAAALAAGSVLVMTFTRFDPPDGDPGLWERVRDAYAAGPVFNHSREEICLLFAGTRLVPPGVVPAHGWRPGWRTRRRPGAAGYILAGAGAVR